jgi:hypothetical protein
MQKRIDKQTARISQTERQLQEARQRLAKYEQKTDDLQPPKQDDFENVEDFLKAQGRYEAEKEHREKTAKAEKERLDREQRAAFEKRSKAFQERQGKFKEKTPDFDNAAAKFNETLKFHHSVDPENKTLQAVAGELMESENLPELGYYLGKNPDEFEKLLEMSPNAALRALGRIEAKLSDAPSKNADPDPEPEPAPKLLPEPPTTVKAKGKTQKPIHERSVDEVLAWVRS